MCLILQIELIWTSVTELYIIIPYNIQTDNKSNSQYSTYIIHDIFFAYWSYVIIIFRHRSYLSITNKKQINQAKEKNPHWNNGVIINFSTRNKH